MFWVNLKPDPPNNFPMMLKMLVNEQHTGHIGDQDPQTACCHHSVMLKGIHTVWGKQAALVAEPSELIRLKCTNHHHRGNLG
jgi:hypothetical protein